MRVLERAGTGQCVNLQRPGAELDAGKSSLVPSRKTCGREYRSSAGVFFGELIETDCWRECACLDRLLWVTSSRSLLYHLGGWLRPEAAVGYLAGSTMIFVYMTAVLYPGSDASISMLSSPISASIGVPKTAKLE